MKKIFAAAAIAAAFIATPALAQGYVGLGLGSSKATGADGTLAGTTVTGANTSKGSVKVYGGFQFTPNWGIEAQYTDLGNRTFQLTNPFVVGVGSGSVKASQFSIAGTGTLPVAANFSLLGKLGVSANRASGSATAPFIVSSANKSDLLVGVGVAYNITPKLAVRLEYEDFGKFTMNGRSARASNTSINLQYRF